MAPPGIILHCLGWVSRGGVELLRVVLAEGLKSNDWVHVVICQVAEPPLLQRLENAGWVVHQIGLAKHPLDIKWYLRGLHLARLVKPDLIHGAVSEGNLLASFIGTLLRSPKVIIEETSDFRGRRLTGDLIFFLMALRANAIIGVSPAVASELRRRVGIFSAKVRTLTNGVLPHRKVSRTREDAIRKALNIEEDDLVLGSTGRLEDSHKKFSDVIRVVCRLSPDFPNLKLVIVGDGDDRGRLEALARDLGVEKRVVFAGHQEQPRDFLEVMDIFVLASAGEALGLALIEAMHASLPCVGSKVGGIPYALEDGLAGTLFESGNLVQLEEKLRTLFGSATLRNQLGARGLARATEHFSSTRYVQEVSGLWDEVLGR